MSSGTCSAAVDGDKCHRPAGHPGDHFGTVDRQREAVLEEVPEPPTEPKIPDSVRTRVELHRAQTQYDLTVLKNRIDCMPTVTMLNRELRRKREQLTAELDAWTYLAGVAKRVD